MKVPILDTSWPTAAAARTSRLFSPLAIGPVSTRTRTWVPAMVPWRATGDGFATEENERWYGRFADGRPGVLVVEATGVRDIPSGPLLRIGDDRFVPGMRRLVETVRERSQGDTRFFIQLIDFLAIRRRPPKDKFLQRFLELKTHHREGLEELGFEDAARGSEEEVRDSLLALPHGELLGVLRAREVEDLEFGYRERVTDTHLSHIAELPKVLPGLFAAATRRARDAGFDGVELHFAHAYTMSSFLSRTNRRTDGYGGAVENRVRLPLEIIAAVRNEVGDDYAVGCRYLSDEIIEGGSRLEEAQYFGEQFARAGLDFLSLSRGGKFDDAKQPKVGAAVYPYTGPSGHECMPTVHIDERGPFGRNLPEVRKIRERVRAAGFETPIVGCGGINSFEAAEGALLRGDCDLVGAARQTLADPDWFSKMESGRGEEIRRCIFTNYCEALDQKHVEVTCQLWDRDFNHPDAGETETATIEGIRRCKDGKRRLEPPAWE